MKKIYNVRYMMNMGCGMDVWRIHGINDHDKSVCPSTPVSFDAVNDTFKTISGSEYQIMNYDCDKDEFVKQIMKDIAEMSYEVH